jgi:GT2 family glycosyltransferase
MSKTLAIILNYNTPELTDSLYQNLKQYEREDYDLIVLDNGSPEQGTSKYTSYKLEENAYYGGGLNAGIQIFTELNSETPNKYDSMLFLNSDIIVHGYNFVKTLRNEMFSNDYKIISPAILQPETNQCFWPTMHNWGSNKTRTVSWVDFQCPLFHADFLNHIVQFDLQLMFGWGNDVYSGLVCMDNGWKVGVVDVCTAVHLNGYTVKNNSNDPIIKNYNIHAERNMVEYFKKINRMDDLLEFRENAKNYTFYNL